MALRDNSQNLTYRIQVSLDAKYAPLIQRGKLLHEQVQRSSFAEKRKAGDTNIDLWLDGNLYPRDPRSGKRLKLNCLKDLLEFVGDGESGLLGYIRSLDSLERLQVQYTDEISALRIRILNLEFDIQIQQNKLRDLPKLFEEIKILQSEKKSCEERLADLQMAVDVGFIDRTSLELKYELTVEEKEQLIVQHVEKLEQVQSELSKSKLALRSMENKCNRLKKTPIGYRSQVRQRRDLSSLSQLGGHAKAQKRLARAIIAPETTKRVQELNVEEGRSGRLHGNQNAQLQSGRLFASMLSRTEAQAMLETPKMTPVGQRMVNYYLDKIGAGIGPAKILEACDRNAITSDGYAAVYKTCKGAVKAAGKGLRVGFLPPPHQVNLLRRQMNSKLEELIGSFYNVNDSLVLNPNPKSKKKEPIHVALNEMNSFFADIEMVQTTMVRLYGITLEELQGDPLIFAIKLDEAEIIYGQKMERVSITLMNRALDSTFSSMTPKELKKDSRYFSVQSEREVWPIASFQVPKESHAVLDWIFSKTKIPSLIEAQGNGQLLKVPEMGEFKVEWHLCADMKTIKVMYGLKHGANSKQTCIYCNQERSKPLITSEEQARLTLSKTTQSWSGGLFATSVHEKPIVGARAAGRWKPILAIPMTRVHICTLHALNRIVEKLIHLHFIFIWTMRDKHQQKIAIDQMQKVLSSTGAHGGNVVMMKDTELSGKSNNVPNKVSLSGANYAKIFKKGTLEGCSEKIYIDIVNATRNFMDGGAAKRQQLEMWEALDDLRQYFIHLTLTDDQVHEYRTKAENWGRLVVTCFGENHVTQYMHVVVRHASYFVNEYGSLSVWSCQGMEASHHVAKATYHRHTQHSGGKYRKSPLKQTFEHWFRIIQHRLRNKEELIQNENEVRDLDLEASCQARRERSMNSSAQIHWEEWRTSMKRDGSRWIPNVEENQ